MKKILSVLLTVAMLASVMTVPALAETTVAKTYFASDIGAHVSNQTAATQVKGVMGRSADDVSTYATRIRPQSEIDANKTDNHKVQYIASTGTDIAGYGDLIVFSISFALQKNIGTVLLTGNGGVNLSSMFALNDKRVNIGWNKLVYIYDHSSAGTAIGEDAGQWAMYLNGECINKLGENVVNMKADNPFNYISRGKMNQMRVMFTSPNAGEELGIYFDDVQCYTVTTDDKAAYAASFGKAAPALKPASNGEYTISGNMVTVASGTKVSSFAAGDGDIAVFASEEFAFTLGADEMAEDGNIIVVSKDGLFTYYKVGAPESESNIVYSTKFSGGSYNSGFTLANAGFYTTEYVAGKAGKSTADTSLNFKRAKTDGQPASWNGNNIYTYIMAPINKAYIKYEINFMPGSEDFKEMNFATQSHAAVSGKLYCTDDGTSANHALNRYQWNKIVYIFKADSADIDTSTYLIPGIRSMYVNGKAVEENVPTNLRKTGNSNTADTMPIRMAIYGKDKAGENGTTNFSAISCFMDDIDVRWYDEAPQLPSMPYAIDDDGETVLAENGTYTIFEDYKVNDIKVSNGAKLTVFDSLTYDYLLIDGNALYDNNLIVISDKNNNYTYYAVKKEKRNNAVITPYLDHYIATANLKDATLILAGYDSTGAMKALNYSKESGNVSVRIDGSYSKVKAFIWNSMNQLIAVTQPKEYNANQVVACWGASITYGQGASTSEAYPAQLAEMTGFTVYNMGIGGETQTTIAARQGGLDLRLTEDITIPASGSVDMMFRAYDKDGEYAGIASPRDVSKAYWNPVTINGVEGSMSVVIDSNWPRTIVSAKFTRKTAGEPAEAKAGTLVIPESHKINRAADITLICVSSNGGWSKDNLTANDGQHQDLIVLIDKMIAASKDPDKYLIVGLTTQDGSAWTNTHKALANKYGDKFLDIKKYITSEQALIDAGITPTAEDMTYIAKGHVPTSLINNPSADMVHLNAAGYKAMARDIFKKFTELGYYIAQ